MPAIQTVMGKATIASGPVFTAVTMASGDSNTVLSFPDGTAAYAIDAGFDGAAAGQLRIRSSRWHDSNTGAIMATSEDPSSRIWPPGAVQKLYSADVLTIELDGTATNVDAFFLSNYYAQAGGLSARLFNWSDVRPQIIAVKPFVTAITNSGTAGTWTDTVITTTDNQLDADSDYAVLGMLSDTHMTVMGFKAPDTASLRVGCPGTTSGQDTADYFIKMADRTGLPTIPVFNANNRGSTYVSTADRTASSTANVTLWLAQLGTRFPAAP